MHYPRMVTGHAHMQVEQLLLHQQICVHARLATLYHTLVEELPTHPPTSIAIVISLLFGVFHGGGGGGGGGGVQ